MNVDAANMDVVKSYLTAGNTIPASFTFLEDEEQTSIGHIERSDEESDAETRTDIDTNMSSGQSSTASTDFIDRTTDSEAHAQKIKSPQKSKVSKTGQKRTYASSSTQIG